MSWPSLLKAKDNVRNVSNEIDRMLKEANSLGKKDLVQYKEILLTHTDESIDGVDAQLVDLKKNLKMHRKYLESKSVFLRRHYKRL